MVGLAFLQNRAISDSQVANDCQAHHHLLGITVSILLLRFPMVLTEMFLRRRADFKVFYQRYSLWVKPLHTNETHKIAHASSGDGSKPRTPGEHQNSW